MTVHHLVNEETIKQQCIYCGNNLSDKKWISEFDFPRHYKTFLCKCGKRLRIMAPFYGSGHDNWPNGKKTESIDEKI